MNTTNYNRPERAAAVLGVPGRFMPAQALDADRWSNQSWISQARQIAGYGTDAEMRVTLRFDDGCRNGHNTFSITADVTTPASRRRRDIEAGGCLHDEIARVFPELAALIPWHLCSSDGPMHYVENTVYLAGDRDYNRLRKGERRQLVNGRTGKPVWNLRADATDCALKTEAKDGDDLTSMPLYRLEDMVTAADVPTNTPRLFWEPCWVVGEGKERELDKARNTAIWPEATDEELSAEPDALRAALAARLPALLARFRDAMTGAGFAWTPADALAGGDA